MAPARSSGDEHLNSKSNRRQWQVIVLAEESSADLRIVGADRARYLLPDIPIPLGRVKVAHEAEFSPASASLWPSEWAISSSHHLKRRADRLLDLQPQPEGRLLGAHQ
jgi:hypothetical protein